MQALRVAVAVLVVAAVVGQLGCAAMGSGAVGPQRAARATQSINLQGFPPEYQQGFTEGCAAVGANPIPKPAGEPNYVTGWRDGFKHCTAKRPQ
jgi:hypothetical protein